MICAPAVIAGFFVSCANEDVNQYNANTYGTADASSPDGASTAANPTYDTPAAYEEASATAVASTAAVTTSPNLPATPATLKPKAKASTATHAPTPIRRTGLPASHGNSSALHTVVKGDTLSGISKKYRVSVASIQQANHMTKDTVVLGSKLTIPEK